MATEAQVFTNKVVSVNPASGEMLRELDCASEPEVNQAVARARASQPAFAELGIRRRIAILKKFQRLLHERKSRVVDLISKGQGVFAIAVDKVWTDLQGSLAKTKKTGRRAVRAGGS